MSKFKVGDTARDCTTGVWYNVVELSSRGNELRLKPFYDTGKEETPGWYFNTGFEKLKEKYEKDDGPLSDEQVGTIKAASSAAELPESAFTEKLFEEPGQIDKTLTERGSRYGSFNDLAQISQALKEAMRATPGWAKLTASQKEALEMVQHKIARMLNGDPTYEDNAVDIVGYATLMMKNMQGDLKI